MRYFDYKTVLVTGATGLLGCNLIKKLMYSSKVKVVALGRNKKKLESTFKEYLEDNNFCVVEHDIASKIPIDINEIDCIFHAASPIAGKTISNSPVDVILPNINGLINCLEFLKKQKEIKGKNGRLVVFSSATVYANYMDNDCVVSENQTNIANALDALSAPYSEAKRMSEVLARAYYRQYAIDVVIARFSYLYGYTVCPPDTAFYEFVRNAVNHKNIVLNNSVLMRRDNLYIDDAVDGLLCVCEKGESGEAYNISSGADKGNYAAIDEIARLIANSANEYFGNGETLEVNVQYKIKEPKYKSGMILDNSKLKLLGWSVNTSLEEGIKKTVEQYIK